MTIHDTQIVPECSLGGLDSQLRNLWLKLDEENDHDLRQSTYCVSERELELCKDIAEAIETAFDKTILYWIRKFKKSNKYDNPEEAYVECQRTVVDHADVVDKKFLEEFVETQMFAYYFDCS